jgi:hypothetical protein
MAAITLMKPASAGDALRDASRADAQHGATDCDDSALFVIEVARMFHTRPEKASARPLLRFSF